MSVHSLQKVERHTRSCPTGLLQLGVASDHTSVLTSELLLLQLQLFLFQLELFVAQCHALAQTLHLMLELLSRVVEFVNKTQVTFSVGLHATHRKL